MTALPDDLEILLDAERDIDVPAPAERRRMFERLEPLLLLPVAAAAAGVVASASTASTASAATTTADAAGSAVLGGALKAKLAAAVVSAALLGGAVGVTGHAYLAPARGSAPMRPVAAPPPLARPMAPPELVPAPDVPAASAPAVVVPPASSATHQEHARPAGSLRAERLLIETASAALVRGDYPSALAALRKHARKFPKGDLAEEREVLLHKALAASGDTAPPEKRPGGSP